MAHPHRVQLHTGRSSGVKVLSGCSSVVVLFLILVTAWIATILSGWLSVVMGAIAALVGVFSVVALGIVLADLLRAAAWLDGRVLAVRSAFTTDRCDLAAAHLFTIDSVAERSYVGDLGSVPTGRLIPRLRVQDPGTGRLVGLALQDPATRTPLPAVRLHALADAIMAGRRPEPYARQAWQVAQELRRLAGDPFAAQP
ncbi:hypothetical protein [Nonomuraea diastatica]|uniref:Uncharacterized protein n=1 Tax=Nonomuraea diastatica TaxID=1848329 RepID=A0A4R4X4T9_9ACTN|nr:hypothetical protein [Nonomuraea diastatica]TDD25348.1 hypothetical protein E1294_03500 [Nonomuraea diastatica]